MVSVALGARSGKMKMTEMEQFLEPTLSHVGFKLDEIQDDTYGDRAAWAIYYRGQDCKLQICWSARDGGMDFMLAPLDAPNEFGLLNRSKKWQFMLLLSGAHDDLTTPGLDADANEVMSWLEALFTIHFESAHDTLRLQSRRNDTTMPNDDFDLSNAICVYLKRYPGNNEDEFASFYGSRSRAAQERVRSILDEAIRIESDWSCLSLNEAGDYVEVVMRERHPELTAKALEAISNYYTFLMR
jgi:hypothetical protein